MKKEESRTGARSPQGFTLIETLFAVIILSSGILFITPAFFRSGQILAYLAHSYEAGLLLNNVIAEKEESLRKFRTLDERISRGQVDSGGVSYAYEVEMTPQNRSGGLYLLTANVRWRDTKQNQVSRTTYILR